MVRIAKVALMARESKAASLNKNARIVKKVGK